MKIAAILLFIFSLLAVNMVGFTLFAIGSTSMASVEGIAQPWMGQLLMLLFFFNMPFLVYSGCFIAGRKSQKKIEVICRSIVFSAWLAFPGSIALFVLVGSKIMWAGLFFPIFQILITVIILSRNKQFDS